MNADNIELLRRLHGGERIKASEIWTKRWQDPPFAELVEHGFIADGSEEAGYSDSRWRDWPEWNPLEITPAGRAVAVCAALMERKAP